VTHSFSVVCVCLSPPPPPPIMTCCLACACCFATCCGERVDRCHAWWSYEVCCSQACYNQCCRYHLYAFDCCPTCGSTTAGDGNAATMQYHTNDHRYSRWRRLLVAGSTLLCYGCVPSCGLTVLGCAEAVQGMATQGSCCPTHTNDRGNLHMRDGFDTCRYGCLNPLVCCTLKRRLALHTCTYCFEPESTQLFGEALTATEVTQLAPLGIIME
jgi:hypothetical protein